MWRGISCLKFPLLLEDNFLRWAKELKYKHKSTTSDQIWWRIWGLYNWPGHHRMLERAHFMLHKLHTTTPRCSLPLRVGYSDLTCSCRSALLLWYLSWVGSLPSASGRFQLAGFYRGFTKNSRMQKVVSSQIWSRAYLLHKKHNQTWECFKALTNRKCQTINLCPRVMTDGKGDTVQKKIWSEI